MCGLDLWSCYRDGGLQKEEKGYCGKTVQYGSAVTIVKVHTYKHR